MTTSKQLIFVGKSLCTVAAIIFAMTFYPVLWEEFSYTVRRTTKLASSSGIKPIDNQFGVVIPKLDANARIIANVDPYNSKEYQVALSRGVAHARGTAFPGDSGNVFLFSHSSVDFYEAMRYNSVFYLLSKLEKGDDILMYYKGYKYRYVVMQKRFVEPNETSFLTTHTTKKQLTLMTCWPPGTTYRRLIVIAQIAAL